VVQSGRKQSVVLIVEDEFLIRMEAVDVIRGAGFHVVDASSFPAANTGQGFGIAGPWLYHVFRGPLRPQCPSLAAGGCGGKLNAGG
jgi:hypothetical protein